MHADAVVVGEAEALWPQLLADFSTHRMKRQYQQAERPSLAGRFPDRSIYGDKTYLPIALVETARGCKFRCEFCSITQFYKRSHRQRPVEDVVKELTALHPRYVFFTDDNIGVNRERFRELVAALICIRDDDRHVFRALLQRTLTRASSAELHQLALGLHERDPLRSALKDYFHVTYRSWLYLVTWEDCAWCRSIDDSLVPYLELGTL